MGSRLKRIRFSRGIAYGLLVVLWCVSGLTFAGAYDSILQAAMNDRTAEVIDYLQRGLDVNTADQDGSTLLLFASRNGNATLVEFLILNKANLNRKNRFGDTPVLLATSQGHTNVVARLTEAGADLNPQGWGPLHYAAYFQRADLVTYLVGKGAKIDALAPNGRSPLMLASELGHLDIAKRLILLGANRALADTEGKSAKDLAQARGFVDVVEFLEAP